MSATRRFATDNCVPAISAALTRLPNPITFGRCEATRLSRRRHTRPPARNSQSARSQVGARAAPVEHLDTRAAVAIDLGQRPRKLRKKYRLGRRGFDQSLARRNQRDRNLMDSRARNVSRRDKSNCLRFDVSLARKRRARHQLQRVACERFQQRVDRIFEHRDRISRRVARLPRSHRVGAHNRGRARARTRAPVHRPSDRRRRGIFCSRHAHRA